MEFGRVRAGRLVRRALGAACLAGLLATSACTEEIFIVRDMGGDDLSVDTDLAGADLTGGPDMACSPQVQSCTGLCGPVRDDCTGQSFQCGACPAGLVCDLNGSHTCVTPKVNCTDLAAECGLTRDSCGNFVQCGNCSGNDKECNPDNNTCMGCQSVTCEDLGYECGTAWLGCGPPSNTTDCGDCSAKPGTVCNQTYHVCESATPTGKTAKQLCDDAKAAKGVECGIITNLNGGTVDCSQFNEYKCPAGQACNTHGIANRCDPFEPPLECVAAGYNCGTMASACGGSINCGDCQPGEVCNMANGQTAGVCGPACSAPQKTCAADYPNVCGKQLDNNCWPKLDCDCGANQVCSTSTAGQTGTCGTAKICTDYTTGQSGQPCSNGAAPAFPKGDGSNLTCPCAAGQCVSGPPGPVVGGTNSGTCCVNTAVCAADSCNTSVTNTCTGAAIPCTCSGGKTCNNATKMCIVPKVCGDYTNGDPGSPCSTGASSSFPRGDGTNLTCPCDPGGQCISGAAPSPPVMGGNAGTCCVNTAMCGGVGTACSVMDSCTNAAINCATGNLICVGGMLQTANTCADYTMGAAGQPCSNGASPSFPRGDGTNLTCNCGGGLTCVDGANMPVSGATTGTCKAANTCAMVAPNRGTVGGGCNDNQTYDNGVGGKIACPCTGGLVCNGDMNVPGQEGMCITPNTCGNYGANGNAGNPCSVNASPAFPRGDGVDLKCVCGGGRVCISGTAPSPQVTGNNSGTCCQPAAAQTCNGACNTTVVVNSCTGATAPCNCSNTQYCSTVGTPGMCLPKKTCASLGKTGAPGSGCNDNVYYDDGSAGGPDFACPCSTATQPNNVCLNDTFSQEGTCQCVPTPCPAGMVGSFYNGCATVVCMGG